MAGYYDAILALIPGVLIGLTAMLMLVGLSYTHAVPVAALASFALIGHAMFVRTPVSATDTALQTNTSIGDAVAD